MDYRGPSPSPCLLLLCCSWRCLMASLHRFLIKEVSNHLHELAADYRGPCYDSTSALILIMTDTVLSSCIQLSKPLQVTVDILCDRGAPEVVLTLMVVGVVWRPTTDHAHCLVVGQAGIQRSVEPATRACCRQQSSNAHMAEQQHQ